MSDFVYLTKQQEGEVIDALQGAKQEIERLRQEIERLRETRDDMATNLNAYVFKLAQAEQERDRLKAALERFMAYGDVYHVKYGEVSPYEQAQQAIGQLSTPKASQPPESSP